MVIINLNKFGSFAMDDKEHYKMAGMALLQSAKLFSMASNTS